MHEISCIVVIFMLFFFKINGRSVVDADHDDVVQLFVSDRSRVALRVHKNKLGLLKVNYQRVNLDLAAFFNLIQN